ncbi:glutamate-cysteine ligase family protein [Streptomyces lavendulae]|uniref:carboxylate-amine ligase n=1 Tax=Streptomyces lavendulae TaxID=1914 RepID=UPI0037FE5A78
MQEARATARLAPLTEEREVQDELLQAQIEVATPVRTAHDEVRGHLLRLRHAVASAAQANGCSKAISVTAPVRDAAPVPILNRLRVWLPTLLAMSANSPLWDGRDTGFAGRRTVAFGRWPVSGPPPHFAGLADYEARAEALVKPGVIPDRCQLYWQARLSERCPHGRGALLRRTTEGR